MSFKNNLKNPIMILTQYTVWARPNIKVFISVLINICKKYIEKLERV